MRFWLPLCLLATAAEAERSEGLGARLLEISVRLRAAARVGDRIELIVTYSNKTSYLSKLDGAYQLGRTQPGLMVSIGDGKTIYESETEEGSWSSIDIRDDSTYSGSVYLPSNMTPNSVGEYTLRLKYQNGSEVTGQGYVRMFEVGAPPLVFHVGSAVEKIDLSSLDFFDKWKDRIIHSEGETREELLAAARRDIGSRRFLVRAITDSSFSLDIRLRASQLLTGCEYQYEKSLVDLLDARNVDTKIKIAVLNVLPWMMPQGGVSSSVVLRRKWDSAASNQDLRYRLALLNILVRSGGMTSAELSSESNKQDDPNVKLLAMDLLVSKNDYQGARIVATELLKTHSYADRSALDPYTTIKPDQEFADIALKYLKFIERLENE
jgi:hypothetical protein